MAGRALSVAVATALCALTLAAPSFAQLSSVGGGCSVTEDAYTFQGQCDPADPGHPFTGFDAGLVGLLGLGLVATGFIVRRTTRRRPLA